MALTPRALLAGAAIIALAFAALLALAYGSAQARWLDAAALQGFLDLQRPVVKSVSQRLVQFGDPVPFALVGCGLAAVALARGRPRVALLVLALLGLTSVSSQLLKALLAYPRAEAQIAEAHIAPAAFPSGHATAAMTLAIALVVVMPARLRPAAAVVGAGLALGVSFSIVSLGWHLPSDAVGGFLLATGWALVLLAALRAADAIFPERRGRSSVAMTTRAAVDGAAAIGLTAVLATGAAIAAAVTTILVVFRLPDLVGYAQDHTAFFVVAGAIALSAVALLAGLAGVLARRS
jgi:membrane-associated phospholipid phosphatase